jgi:D-glycero-D-manno-heptose 1,7-bisphosphate phosphatase
MRRNVVFIDRDGVINRESPDYIKGPEEFRFLPGSLEALRRLTEEGYALIVVTNQSALHRRLISPAGLAQIHQEMCRAVAGSGGAVLDILVCPHLPEEGCDCRKPKPGMLLAAQRKHRIDLSSAILIGDKASDIACGVNARLRATVLVRTGHGRAAEIELAAHGPGPDLVADDLRAASEEIPRRWPPRSRYRVGPAEES